MKSRSCTGFSSGPVFRESRLRIVGPATDLRAALLPKRGPTRFLTLVLGAGTENHDQINTIDTAINLMEIAESIAPDKDRRGVCLIISNGTRPRKHLDKSNIPFLCRIPAASL